MKKTRFIWRCDDIIKFPPNLQIFRIITAKITQKSIKNDKKGRKNAKFTDNF